MAVIHIISLDADIERAIKEKSYSEAQIIELNKKLQKDRNDRKKVFLIVMVLISVGILGYGTYVIGKTIGFPQAVPILLFFILFLPIIGAVIWYAVVGNMMRQWNSLVRQYYPNVYTKLKREADGTITAEEAEKPVCMSLFTKDYSIWKKTAVLFWNRERRGWAIFGNCCKMTVRSLVIRLFSGIKRMLQESIKSVCA